MNGITRRIRLMLLLAVSAAMVLSACGQSGEPAEPAQTEVQEEEAVNNEPAVEPEPTGPVAPFTGLITQADPTARPVAVMINNHSKARPQSGLTHADMIWEVLAEGGITRLIAVFQSDTFTDPVGPVRSIRPYLIDLAESYQAIISHAGASNDAYAILQRQKKPYLDEISNAGSYFWRDKSRKAPHNLYTDIEKLRSGAASKKYEESVTIPVYRFSEKDAMPAGEDATKLEIMFQMQNYKVSYVYDADSRLYARSVNNEPHVDMNNSEQLKASNLVVLGTAHQVLDNVGRLAVDLDSGGPAMLFQGGKVIEVEWQRGGDDVIRIMKDGSELPFIPGKTFYHIVPMQPSFDSHLTYGTDASGADSQPEGAQKQ
ncbi:DUF3048 domain-containing protein [Paenibacillus tarimensis]|uniref:DUF3048 domain-containing protein n=1 Tax=Paenibacillus tarimensis TaxID=416012 RepID=UPI001F20D4C5|nr:DUF3048 domain-containing protein [Paenibacillus tarimensis]MCF2946308.1 DUF3048 domain-containing protein [Paenibacillus tarimensis]